METRIIGWRLRRWSQSWRSLSSFSSGLRSGFVNTVGDLGMPHEPLLAIPSMRCSGLESFAVPVRQWERSSPCSFTCRLAGLPTCSSRSRSYWSCSRPSPLRPRSTESRPARILPVRRPLHPPRRTHQCDRGGSISGSLAALGAFCGRVACDRLRRR